MCCCHVPLTCRYLHAIGEVVYYADVPALSDAVMLDPVWLTADVLGRVLSPTKENLRSIDTLIDARADGTYDSAELAQVLCPPGSPMHNARDKVVPLLCRMNLAVLKDEGCVLVSSLLKVRRRVLCS